MSPWEFACDWYKESEIEHTLKNMEAARLPPNPSDTARFAAWLAHEYRLAMNKGIEIGRNWSQDHD